jgi:hypothetical protein
LIAKIATIASIVGSPVTIACALTVISAHHAQIAQIAHHAQIAKMPVTATAMKATLVVIHASLLDRIER